MSTDEIMNFNGIYCPQCKEHCNGYTMLGGKPICYNCNSIMRDLDDDEKEKNEWAIIGESSDTPIALRPIDDKVLVLEDKFKSGYECKVCNGRGHTDEPCPNCQGTGMEKARAADGVEMFGPCRSCTVGQSDGRKTMKYKLCPACNGRQSLLIIPEQNERRPTTGKVIAIGQNVTQYKVGTTVVFTNYTGTKFELNDCVLRVIKQHDILCEAKYLKSERTLEEKGWTDLSKVGINE